MKIAAFQAGPKTEPYLKVYDPVYHKRSIYKVDLYRFLKRFQVL